MSECINCGEHGQFQQLDERNATEKPDDGLCTYCRTDRDAAFAAADPLTIDETRRRIRALPVTDRCHEACPCWDVFESDRNGLCIEVCDECASQMDDSQAVDDEDVGQLPEAKDALAEAIRVRAADRASDRRKHPRVAIVTVRDAIRVSIEMRPPKSGELGWCVTRDADAREALAQVLDGRSTTDEGEYGFGWHAQDDQPEFEPDCGDEEGGRNITVIVEHDAAYGASGSDEIKLL